MSQPQFLFTALLFLASPAWAETPEVSRLLDKLDSLYRSEKSYCRMEMSIKTSGFERSLEVEVWTEGLEKTFLTVLAPAKDKGMSTLRIGKEMWNFFPNISKVMTVPPSMMMASWMGSDFTNDDLVKESTFRKDYSGAIVPSQQAGEIRLELKPKEATATVWGSIQVFLGAEDSLPRRQEFFDEKGRHKRTIHFEQVAQLGGRKLPTVMRLENLSKPGQSTLIRYREARFDIALPPETFTLRNLQKKR